MKRRSFVFLLLFFSACRVTGGDVTAPNADTAALEPVARSVVLFQTGLASFETALSAAFSDDFEASLTGQAVTPVAGDYEWRQSKLCDDEGGVADLTENVTDGVGNGTFLVEMDLEDCGGADGLFSAVGTFTRANATISFQGDFTDGLNDADCDADFSSLNFFSAAPGALVVSGTLTAACASDGSSADVTCTWGETATDDTDALAAACTCEGSAC